MICGREKEGKIFPKQHWVELHGVFTSMELRELVIKIEEAISNPDKNGNKK